MLYEVITLNTAGEADYIALSVDKTQINANSQDVVHIEAQIVDKSGIPVQTKESQIHFQIKGKCRILGVDNGRSDSVQDYSYNFV